MAGVKGRSGGKRAGAGRKPKPSDAAPDDCKDVVAFLKLAALGKVEPSPTQVRAAAVYLQYKTGKITDKGKKAARRDAAREVAHGRFAPLPAPILRVVK